MNVIWFCIDTLRADHLGCYGYFRDTSPTIDRLARQGVLFRDSHASAVATGPGFTSLITGRAAINHEFYLTPFRWPDLINFSDAIPTIPEMIQDRGGITTAAFDNLMNFASHMKQFVRGFEFYINVTRTSRPIHHHVPGDWVNARLLPWLRQHADEQFFLFVHYWDPHGPYNQPDEYWTLFRHRKGDLSDLKVERAPAGYEYVPGWGKVGEFFEAEEVPMPPDRFNRHRPSIDLYDGEIRFTDDLIAEVLQTLEEAGILDDTAVLITADHGEQLGQHGLYGHAGLHEANIHIPLVLWRPGVVPEGKVVEGFVQQADVGPTILDLLGVEPQGKLDGRSLLPLARGEVSPPASMVAEETGERCLLREGWKYIWHYPGEVTAFEWPYCGRDELYHYAADPMEVVNLIEDEPERAAEMRAELEEWVRTQLAGREDPLPAQADLMAEIFRRERK
ncbi:MAG TPA: hypothetical protein EYP85_03690 [Armatimonadetes bacterium]|nr:hypothetical protein [Armatimonadota bacterium]